MGAMVRSIHSPTRLQCFCSIFFYYVQFIYILGLRSFIVLLPDAVRPDQNNGMAEAAAFTLC